MKKMKRHTCVICKKKRIEIKMSKVFLQSWACNYKCVENREIIEAEQILFMISKWKKLSLKHL